MERTQETSDNLLCRRVRTPTEMNLTKEYAKIGALASLLNDKNRLNICLRYVSFSRINSSALNEAGLRGVVCGPQTQWPPREGGDDGSVRRELDSQLASNKAESKVNYGVATMLFTHVMKIHYSKAKNWRRNTILTFQSTYPNPKGGC